MDSTGMRSLFTCRGCNEVVLRCRGRTLCARGTNHLSLSLISLTFHLFSPQVYVKVYVYICVFGKERLCRCVCVCVCVPGRSQIAAAITHTNSESSTLLSPYSEIRLWIPLALQFDQSADLQPPLQHTDEA